MATRKAAPGTRPERSVEVAKAPKYKWPKSLGACADRLYELKSQRSAAQKVADDLEREEKALKQHLIDTLPKSEASGVSGRVANVKVLTKQVPSVTDWPAFYAYITKNKAFDLLQRRVNEGAVQERWDAKKKVPGVEPFGAVTVSLTKLG